jgi:hypothetical protein
MDTIIVAAAHAKRVSGMLSEDTRLDLLPDGPIGRRHFKIKTAETAAHRRSASVLLKDRYAWRGYRAVALPTDPTTNKITLSAIEHDLTIGTITVSLDGPDGLAADSTFAIEVGAMRAAGRRVCEFTKLAVDPISGTKRVLAALIHVAYVVAHRLRAYDVIVIEVNPRHVKYYERMLGFRVVGAERPNHGVQPPAVMLAADFSYIKQQIDTFGGHPEKAADERSLYPHFFSLKEEAGIIHRMMSAQRPASASIN